MSSERFAVIIGINEYADPNIEALDYAEQDALAVYSTLVAQAGGFPRENVQLLLGSQATFRNIRQTLTTFLLKNVHQDDCVLIYFAGYGGIEGRPHCQNVDDEWIHYLVPYDAVYDQFLSTAFSFEELGQYLAPLPASEVYFFFDSCFKPGQGSRGLVNSAKGEQANLNDRFLDPLLQGRGRMVITAGQPHQSCFESEMLQRGIFTHGLVEGLKGGANRESLHITSDDLYRYLEKQVPALAKQVGCYQKIHLRGTPSVDFKISSMARGEKGPQITDRPPRLMHKGEHVELAQTPFLLGSSTLCHLKIPTASSIHGEILRAHQNFLKLRTLTSKPIEVNGRPIREKILYEGDEIVIGREVLTFIKSYHVSEMGGEEKTISQANVLETLQIAEWELDGLIQSGELEVVEEDGRRRFRKWQVEEVRMTREVQPTMDMNLGSDKIKDIQAEYEAALVREAEEGSPTSDPEPKEDSTSPEEKKAEAEKADEAKPDEKQDKPSGEEKADEAKPSEEEKPEGDQNKEKAKREGKPEDSSGSKEEEKGDEGNDKVDDKRSTVSISTKGWIQSWPETCSSGREVTVVQPKGAVTGQNVGDFQLALEAISTDLAIIDFSGILWLNAKGVTAVIDQLQKFQDKGGVVALVSVRDRILDSLKKSEGADGLVFYGKIEEALEGMSS